MSLMKLAPESVRLRRIARACAAGEFSEEEYRLARREVIANFVATAPDDDDTQPRQTTTDVEPVRQPASSPKRGRALWLIALAIGALLAATGVFADAGFHIPALAERDPNPATSPRLPVETVTVSNFQPLSGIRRQELDAQIAEKLAALRDRAQPGEHGFTGGELEEIGRLLNALGVHDGESQLGSADLRDLQALIAQQKERRGISVVELEEVAATVQQIYRDAGYFLAVAYVPEQRVQDHQVSIEVLPGILGGIHVEGDDLAVAHRFDDLVGQPVTEEVVTTRLYALNQTPGLNAQVSFEPGEQIGETLLNLEVVPQQSWTGSLAVDNHGDQATGEQRLLADASVLNLTGRGDVIDFGVLFSLEQADQVYGYLGYATPLAGRTHFDTRLAYTRFEADLSNSPERVDSDGLLLDFSFDRIIRQARERGMSYRIGGGYHRLNWDAAPPQPNGTQDVFFANVGLQTHAVWDSVRVAADASLTLEAGTIQGATFIGQDSNYWLTGLEAFAWHPLDLPLLPGEQKVSMTFFGQLADAELPSSRRFALGGNLAVRAYQRDAYLADSGALLRLDLRTPVPVGELSLFADSAYGETLNDDDTDWGYLSGVGIAWNVNWSGLESRLSWAYPLASNGSGGLDDDGTQIFWSFSYRR